MAHYVHVRQQYLVSPSHSSTAQARTVLVTGIPQEFLTESALTRLFSHLPGGVRKVWINRDLGDMPHLYNQRLKASQMLESAATSLLNMAIKRDRNRLRNPVKFVDGDQIVSNSELTSFVSDPETQDTHLEELVSKHKRPSHRLPLFSSLPFSVPLLGKKVDTIKWACERIHKLNTELAQRREVLARDVAWTTGAEAQATSRTEKSNIAIPAVPDSIPLFGTRAVVDFSGLTYPPANGAFILFNRQIAAHIAAQTLTHHEPYCMPSSLKYVEATSEDVIWKNLVLNPYRRRVRLALSRTVGIVLMIVWTIPGKLRLTLQHLELNGAYSVDYRNSLTCPVRPVHCVWPSLHLQLQKHSRQLLPGCLLCGIAYSPPHVRPVSVPYIGTLGRHHSADPRGAQT
jgi:hypothetical protein